MDLTISIINHNHCDMVVPLLDSIIVHTHSISYEVFVINNVPDDGCSNKLASRFPQINMLDNDQPLGFAANNNQVLRLARGRYTILLNDDMLLINDALDRMVAYMDGNVSVGAIGCQLLNRDGTLQRSSWRGFPSFRTLFVDLFYLSKWFPRLSLVRRFEATFQSSNPVDVDYLLGACIMVRSKVIEQVGLLDERFFMFLEETDWCFRIKQHGWQIFWVPDAKIVHYGQQSVSRDPERFVPMLYGNYCRFGRKHGYGRWEILALKTTLFLGLLFRSGLWAIRQLKHVPNSSAMMWGYLRAVCSLPSM